MHSRDINCAEDIPEFIEGVEFILEEQALELENIFAEQEEFERFMQNNSDDIVAADEKSVEPTFHFFSSVWSIFTSITMMIRGFFIPNRNVC